MDNLYEGLDEYPFENDEVTSEPPFYIDEKTDTSSTVLVGQSRAGKSVLINYLWNKYFKSHITVLMTPNYQANVYKKMRESPRVIIANDFIPNIITIMNKLNQASNNKYKFLVIGDDLIDSRYKAELKKLLLSLRNSNISSILGIQWPPLIDPSMRNNANNLCLLTFNKPEGRSKIVRDYIPNMFGNISQKKGMKLYKILTQDHHFILNDQDGNKHICKVRLPDWLAKIEDAERKKKEAKKLLANKMPIASQ